MLEASQIFSINFILHLSDSYRQLVYILIYLTKCSKHWGMKAYYKTKSFKIVQATYRRESDFQVSLELLISWHLWRS